MTPKQLLYFRVAARTPQLIEAFGAIGAEEVLLSRLVAWHDRVSGDAVMPTHKQRMEAAVNATPSNTNPRMEAVNDS